MSNQSILKKTASELSTLIARQELTSEQVVYAHWENMVQLQPALNAAAFIRWEGALKEARILDQQLAGGKIKGTLHGVPFTVKDWIDVAGMPCAGGDIKYAKRVPAQDATVVRRLRQAGGIVLAKSAVLVEAEMYGRVCNPHQVGASPGGSSSGEAALIAAYASPLGIGSDSGGSIRQPAGYCGITGLKPTSGRVPLTGHFPQINPLADPRTVIGPMARSVQDLCLALNIIAGEDGVDPSVMPVPLSSAMDVAIPGLRVAFYTSVDEALNVAPVAQEIVQAVQNVAKLLEKSGCQVQEMAPPLSIEAMAITRDYWARPESGSWDEWQVNSMVSTLSADRVEQHLFAWDKYRRSLLRFMNDVDIIICPIAERTAALTGEDEGSVIFTAPYSLTGYPVVAIPVTKSSNGLPIGVQVIAGPWREDRALAVALVIEQAFGGAPL
ncbi:amidase [Janthinobacterium sp. 75]|uniref:amidase n=1 Tax=Janthinobacterium sp. 75 TaxID=2135628 RepID=UPI001062752D|nr:amidase [Janthinobacterium sp. 75]TDY35765.1 amidase [Janthinobacterium sp. 75]